MSHLKKEKRIVAFHISEYKCIQNRRHNEVQEAYEKKILRFRFASIKRLEVKILFSSSFEAMVVEQFSM